MRHDKALRFLADATHFANVFSKDSSTKVGAIFVDPTDFTQLSQGYNGMPRGTREDLAERHERPLKYDFFEHAERNAIFNKARGFLVGSVALMTRMPNIGCVRALVSVGVSEVWIPRPSPDAVNTVTKQLLQEAGVRVRVYDPGNLTSVESLDADSPAEARHFRKIAKYLAYTHALPGLHAKDPYADATIFLSPGDYTLLTRGYSGMPRGARDDQVGRFEEPLRQLWVEGSVRNAIFNLMRPIFKGSEALVTATTCGECARALASVGVRKVYYIEPTSDFIARWGPSITTALNMLDELGIAHEQVARQDLPT
jgi:dCMP deaminase